MKLKFLLPNIKTAHKVNEGLQTSKLDSKDVSFLAKPATDLNPLPEADATEATNTLNEGVKGIFMGAGVGLLAGLYVLYFPKWFTDSPTWFTNTSPAVILLVTALIGAVAAAFGASLLGINILNRDLRQFKKSIDHGAVLLIVTVPFNRANEIRQVVRRYAS